MLESTLYLTLIDHSHCPSLSYPSGGTSGGRTRDLLFAGQVLSQLSYSPINKALRSANRTFVDCWNFCFSNRQNFLSPRIKPCRNLILKTHTSRVLCRYQPIANMAGISFTAVQVSRVYFFGERYYRVAVSFGSGI